MADSVNINVIDAPEVIINSTEEITKVSVSVQDDERVVVVNIVDGYDGEGISVTNSDGSLVLNITDDTVLNDIDFTDSTGITTQVPAGKNVVATPQAACEDATYQNSNNSFNGSIASGGDLVLPNIDFTDSDGTTTSVPSMEDVVATPTPVKAGIKYKRPNITGQTTSYTVGDDGWHLANGTYDYTPPAHPVSFARLDTTHATPFLMLVENNAFGNKNRFTDKDGLQVYADNYIIDHLTGLGYYPIEVIEPLLYDWSSGITTSNSLVYLGFSDYRMTNVNELDSIFNFDSASLLNYAPFNLNLAKYFYTSTTDETDTTRAIIIRTNTYGVTLNAKTSTNRQVLAVRNHYN